MNLMTFYKPIIYFLLFIQKIFSKKKNEETREITQEYHDYTVQGEDYSGEMSKKYLILDAPSEVEAKSFVEQTQELEYDLVCAHKVNVCYCITVQDDNCKEHDIYLPFRDVDNVNLEDLLKNEGWEYDTYDIIDDFCEEYMTDEGDWICMVGDQLEYYDK